MVTTLRQRAGGEIIAKRLVGLSDTGIGHIVREVIERRPPIVFNTLVGEASYRFYRDLHRALSREQTRTPGVPRQVGEAEAFRMLRRAAMSRRQTVEAVSAQVVAGELPLPRLLAS